MLGGGWGVAGMKTGFFAPCVWVDRRVWHREIDIMEVFGRDNRDASGTDGTPRGEDEGRP